MLIGQSRIDITPYINISMCGHGEDRFTGLKDKLYATAIIFCQKEIKVCLITADLIGFTKDFTDNVKSRISNLLRINKENIILCASHTHTGPDVMWPLKSKNNIRYINELKKKLVNVAKKADESLIESLIEVGVGKASIGINRRLKVKNVIQFAPNPKGVYDRDVIVVKISSFGELRGLIISHACHPTSEQGMVISADYPGKVRDLLKKRYGSRIIISFLLGCCGDVRPNGPYKKGKWTPLTSKQLLKFKDTVVKVTEDIIEDKYPALSFIHSKIKLPMDINRFNLSELKKRYESIARSIRKEGITEADPKGKHYFLRYMKTLEKAIRIKVHKQSIAPVSLDIALLRIGKIIFVFLPGEVFTEIGLQIKKLRKDCIIVPVALYNVLSPYSCTEKACKEGGFETKVSVFWYGSQYPFPRSGKCEKIIVEKVSSLLGRKNKSIRKCKML